MTQFTTALVNALKNTGIIVIFLAIVISGFAIVLGPVVLLLGLNGPVWAIVLAAVWAAISFIFAMALLHQLEENW
jgi:pilus assembly protein TadC